MRSASLSLAFLRVGFGLWDLLYGFSLATLPERIGSFFKVLLLVVTMPLALTALFGETLRLHAPA